MLPLRANPHGRAARPPAPSERRTYPRHHPARRPNCLLRRRADGPSFQGRVRNLSARGLALLVGEAVEPGSVLWVRLINEGLTFCVAAKLRVTRSEHLAGGEHVIAGELDQVLEPADLLPFLL